jgi:flagellar biosynthesis chaperone FliJ
MNITEKRTATTDEKFVALTIAQNLIKASGSKMTHNQLKAIHNFISRLNNGKTRNKVTFYECEKIINTARTFSK